MGSRHSIRVAESARGLSPAAPPHVDINAATAMAALVSRRPLLIWYLTSWALLSGRLCGRLVCWQALLKCHGEPECHYAYTQYVHACAPVLAGGGGRCPSHCISSIVQLNLTAGGPALEDCDCAEDPLCRGAKSAIEPCMPRTRRTGCTEARRRCDEDAPCRGAVRDYLFHCRKLFGGERCSEPCRRVIAAMRAIPAARLLDTCVCDGAERPICEYIRASMESFCFGPGDRERGSGAPDSEEDADEDYGPEEDAVPERAAGPRGGGGGGGGSVAVSVALACCSWALLAR
uniref:GDNF/GAS1 domain-containing protein n=1 Tax=Denticeps clupeoides TaxID=299321 RepID=A0AAY4ETJ8_9TELE